MGLSYSHRLAFFEPGYQLGGISPRFLMLSLGLHLVIFAILPFLRGPNEGPLETLQLSLIPSEFSQVNAHPPKASPPPALPAPVVSEPPVPSGNVSFKAAPPPKAPKPIKTTPPQPPAPKEKSFAEVLESTKTLKKKPDVVKPVPKENLSAQAQNLLAGLKTDLPAVSKASPAAAAPALATGTAVTQMNREQALAYHQTLKATLGTFWKLPPHLVGQGLQVSVLFQIKKSGEIIDWKVEEWTTNDLFNASIKSLLEQLQALPALPDSFPEAKYEIGLNFNPTSFR